MKLWIFGTIEYYRPKWCSKRGFRFLWQKLTRGFSDDALWSLDYTIAKFALPRLKEFHLWEHPHPGCYTPEQWSAIVDKMIYAMEAVVKDGEGTLYEDCHEFEDYQQVDRKIREGLTLFGRNFRRLWL